MRMRKNKKGWLKYLLDFIIVFLGVTMAFLLNTWYVNLYSGNQETIQLISVMQDLKENRWMHENHFREDSLWIEKADELLTELEKNKSVKLDSLHTILNLIKESRNVNYRNGGYQLLLNSKDLHLRKNIELKNNLRSYYSNYLYDVVRFENEINNIYKEYYLELFMENNDNWGNEDAINRSINILKLNLTYKRKLLGLHKKAINKIKELFRAIDNYSENINVTY